MANQKKKKEEINWISFYLFTIQWVHTRINICSWTSKYYFKQWLMWIRLGMLFMLSFILVLGSSISALLFVVKFAIIYIMIEIALVIMTYYLIRTDKVHKRKFDQLSEEEKLLHATSEGSIRDDILNIYKSILKKNNNESA